MYLLGYSLDNLSLMALTIATGFVVDDAIVVVENIDAPYRSRHDARRGRASRRAAKSVSLSLSISLSLIAVFMPILLMGGIVGRLFREFAVTLRSPILISLVISLTTTPMMCALFMRKSHGAEAASLFSKFVRALFSRPMATACPGPCAIRPDHPACSP